jgi:hypothetical protein
MKVATRSSTAVLDELRALVLRERDVALARLLKTWSQPLAGKLAKGLTQRFLRLGKGPGAGTIWAYPDRGESRFRVGDLWCLHLDSPLAIHASSSCRTSAPATIACCQDAQRWPPRDCRCWCCCGPAARTRPARSHRKPVRGTAACA